MKIFPREIRFLEKLFEVRLTHRRTTFHAPMMLRAGQRVSLVGLFDHRAGLDIFSAENFIRVEADARADASGFFATVTEREAERIIRHARLRPNRTGNGFAVQ